MLLLISAWDIFKQLDQNFSIPYIAGLRQLWRHITDQTVLTQEEIPEEGG